jgi:S1-C subfamily serine protease
MRKLLPLLLIFILAACHGLTVQRHELQPWPQIPEDAQPAPISIDKIKYGVPTGTALAATSPKGLFGFFLCGSPYDQMETSVVAKHFNKDERGRMVDLLEEALEAQGYDVVGDPGRLFEEDADHYRTIYSIGAYVTTLRLDLCNRRTFWLNYERGYSGEAEIGVDWTIYDRLRRKVVLKTHTGGYSKLTIPNYEGIELLIQDAFSAAIHNLGSSEEFRNLIVFGEMPDKVPESIQDINEDPEGLYDPLEKVHIENLPLFTEPAAGRLEEIRDAAVLIQTGMAHGSGFFISDKGHILTTANAIGNAFRVRVVTSGSKDKLIAEVLRVDRHRDVALLRLEHMPPGINKRVLPIKTDRPRVGDEIYTIGAPYEYYLQDTVTKGIVSAVRFKRYKKLWFIHGDITGQKGNSGGPLLDVNGNVIGICNPAVPEEEERDRSGGTLHQFIPIADALERLNITIGE